METHPTMPALVHPGDLAPRARQLLAQQLEEYGNLLDPLVRGTLDDLEHELFGIAEQSSGGQAQHEALEALREVKRNRPGFHAYLLAQLEHSFDEIDATGAGADIESAPYDIDELELVDPREFDESMALDDLSTRTELHAGNGLFGLCHRYAVLLATPPLDADALPTGPRALASALGQASRKLGLQREHRLLFYRLCDRRLFGAAESIYSQLNQHLKSAGVLPHLRSYLRRKGGNAAPRAPESATSESPAPAAPPSLPSAARYSPSQASTQAPQPGPRSAAQAPPLPDLHELHMLLDTRRNLMEPAAGGTPSAAARVASLDELGKALATLQAQAAQATIPRAGERLQGDLLATLRSISGDGEELQLQPEHRDATDLMSLLYDQLLDETREEGTARQLLAGLQVPLLRVALTDSGFFTVRNHPARRLLNMVLETANLWLDRSGDRFDTSLHQRLKRTVKRIAETPADDPRALEREADDLETHLRILARRAEIAERRHVEAAQGRDRLREARAKAGKAVAARIGKRRISPLVRALLESAWVDALTLTLLRDGEDSEAYKRRLAAADQLLGPATARDNTRLAADLAHGLAQVGLQAAEAEQVTRYALELPQPDATRSATPTPSQTELLIRLKSRHRADETEEPSGSATPRPLPLTPTERRSLEVLKQLAFGSWLEFTVNQQGQKVAYKLAWYTPSSGRCLLVTARGAPARERNLEQVARLMARGQVRVLPRQDGGMIDRAWNSLVAGLRKLGGSSTKSETAT